MQLKYYDMGRGVRAFSTTRHGGVGNGAYASFNINPFCGDDVNDVAQNTELLCCELGISRENLVFAHQTHGAEIAHINSLPADVLEGVDALVTSLPNVCIGVSTADCIPVLLYSAEQHVVAAIHAGWRGTVARIVAKTVAEMGAAPERISAIIGPGISLENFEVGDEVYEAFAAANFRMQAIAQKFGCKWHIDLWEANRLELVGAGVLPQNIQVAGICTYNNVCDYFSARRLGTASGRIFNGIILNGL